MKNLVGMACAVALAGSAGAAMFKDGDRVACFGDSITHGGGYHRFLADYYLTRCPDADIRFINSGSGGDNAGHALTRVQKDLTDRRPTVVTLMFGMNDFGFREYGDAVTAKQVAEREKRLSDYAANMAALIVGVRKACGNVGLYVMTPTPFDDTAIFPDGKKVNEFVGAHAGLGRCAETVRTLAAEKGIPCVDFYTAVSAEIRARRLADPSVTFASDRIHPCSGIHLLMALTFLEAQNADRVVSDVAIQDGRVTKHVKAEVTDLVTNATGGVAFTLREKSLPMPFDLNEVSAFTNLPQVAAINQEILAFYSLADGDWTLKIDGRPVRTASARDWAIGVNLAFNPLTPQYRQAQDVGRANHRRHDRHGGICASSASIIRSVSALMKHRGLDPTNADDRAKYLAERMPKLNPWDIQPWKTTFAEWDRQDEKVRVCIEDDWPELRKLAQPVPHRYELVRK